MLALFNQLTRRGLEHLGGVNWLAVHAYASQRLRARYAGSVLGEFWLVATTAVFLMAVALVWSMLWRISLDDYFAYFATGFIFYTFIAGTMNEAAGTIIADSRLYLNSKLSPMFSVFAHIYRSVLSFAHQLVIILFVALFFASTSLAGIATTVSGTLLCVLFLVPSCYLLGMLSVRYRDLLHVIHSIFQILFLITPVMWRIDRVPEVYQPWVFINPVASFLNITRDAFLNLPVYREAVISALLWTLLAWLVHWFLARRLEKHFTLWL